MSNEVHGNSTESAQKRPAKRPAKRQDNSGRSAQFAPPPADLTLVVNAWERLSEKTKRTILGMIANEAEDRADA